MTITEAFICGLIVGVIGAQPLFAVGLIAWSCWSNIPIQEEPKQ